MHADSVEHELAGQLGVDVGSFVEIFGAGWSALPADLDTGGLDESRWFVAGAPAQLMLSVGDDIVRLARPRGRWEGVAGLRLEPHDERTLPRFLGDPDEARRQVKDLLQRRRASFRYCRYCLELTPPEYWHSGACMSCASQWQGVLY